MHERWNIVTISDGVTTNAMRENLEALLRKAVLEAQGKSLESCDV